MKKTNAIKKNLTNRNFRLWASGIALFAFILLATPAMADVSRSDFTRLGTMEQTLLNARYEADTLETRLNRLEEVIFGETFPAKPPEERLASLSNILSRQKTTAAPASVEKTLVKSGNNAQTSNPNIQEAGNHPALSVIENRVFGKTYEKEDIQARLNRIEAQVFGMPQQGTLISRVDALRLTVLGDANTAAPPQKGNFAYQNPYPPPGNITYPQGGSIAPSPDLPPDNFQNQQPTPVYFNPNQTTATSPDMNAALTKIEQNVLKRTYPSDSVGQRLDRLEMNIFQATSPPEMSDEDRFQRITAVTAADGDDPRPQGRGAFIKSLIPVLIMMIPMFL